MPAPSVAAPQHLGEKWSVMRWVGELVRVGLLHIQHPAKKDRL